MVALVTDKLMIFTLVATEDQSQDPIANAEEACSDDFGLDLRNFGCA